ncbi:NUDIX hydrolase [Paenirhodobacter enshiensis]|uniref:NUDIX hydrolase n=1 Tax=Paenirhodobacter enshiensis TaxID=1105367 RepID=A0A086Y417_9RHOB|nr:NUDIX hydrolase [Paenirhodobacter enshiensis]KFI29017.1 NUDIX hydrolase [Paenirhodobacter enshiensis]
MRRFGEAIVRGQTYRKRPGAYAILERDGQILLTHQQAPVPEYQLPGGGIDPGEGALQALHREAFEETGWSIANPRRLGAYRRFVWMPEYEFWAEKICSIFVARPILQHSAPREMGHTAVWVTPEEALDLLANQGDRHFLARWLGH